MKAEEQKKPSISETEAKKNLDGLLFGVYEDSKKYDFPLKEDYVKSVSSDIWPDVRYLLERRFVIIDK